MSIKETVLLLGGTGFIGKNIIDFVVKNQKISDFKFVVLARNLPKETIDAIDYVVGDYGDKQVLISLFAKWGFTKVFHCATSTTPISSENNFISDIDGNLKASIGLLDVMKEYHCSYILFLSSGGAVYGEKQLSKICEKEICDPVSSYGVVKLTIENYLKLYQKLFRINYLILRVSNPFGKYHISEKQGVINIAIRRALRGEAMEVWGDGLQSKDYIFADDLAKIIFQLVENKILNRTINVGSGKTYQLNGIIDKIKSHLPTLEVKYVGPKTTDVKSFCLDILILRSLMSFDFTNFDDAIINTIKWEKTQI